MGNPIDVESKVEVYERNGSDLGGLKSDKEPLIVKNHWNRREFVVLQYEDKEITVVVGDLERAIKNAYNAHGF